MTLEKINELFKELGLKANKVWTEGAHIIYRFWMPSIERINEIVKPLGLIADSIWNDPTSLFFRFKKVEIKEEDIPIVEEVVEVEEGYDIKEVVDEVVKEIESETIEVPIEEAPLKYLTEEQLKEMIESKEKIEEKPTDIDELVEDFVEDIEDIVEDKVIEAVEELRIPIPPEKVEKVKDLLDKLKE